MRRLAWLLILVSGQMAFAQGDANVQPDPNRFSRDIVEFERWDAQNTPAQDAVLFVGSSSIRMWQTGKFFEGLPVINRGFGGSHISDVLFYFSRIVLPYRPRVIVLYAGDNDIASGKSPERVLADFEQFVSMVGAELPRTRVIFVSMKPSESRWALWPVVQQGNALIKEYCGKNGRLTYVDAGTVLLDEQGKPDGQYFRGDKLHLNERGYQRWTRVLRPVIEREYSREGE